MCCSFDFCKKSLTVSVGVALWVVCGVCFVALSMKFFMILSIKVLVYPLLTSTCFTREISVLKYACVEHVVHALLM